MVETPNNPTRRFQVGDRVRPKPGARVGDSIGDGKVGDVIG